MNIIWKGSPNYGATRFGNQVEYIVCHWIVGTLASADAVFANPNSDVSAHYAVGNGEIHQYVKESDTAWHAGNQTANRKSIGIEHQGAPTMPITDATYNTSADLIADICRRYGKRFPLRAHREFVATACPGTLDLNRLNQLVDARLLNNGASNMNPTPGAVKDLYRIFLGREASDAEANSWATQTWDKTFYGIKDSPEAQARAKVVNAKLSGYDVLTKQVSELSTRPTKAELDAVVTNLKLSQEKVSELEKQVKENPDTVLIDEGKNWLQKLIARFTKGQ